MVSLVDPICYVLKCFWKTKYGFIITPTIFGLRSSGSCVSSRVIFGYVWNWCVTGVKSVTVDFSGDIRSEFSFRYIPTSIR